MDDVGVPRPSTGSTAMLLHPYHATLATLVHTGAPASSEIELLTQLLTCRKLALCQAGRLTCYRDCKFHWLV